MATIQDVETHLSARLASPLPGPEALRRFAPRPPRGNWDPSRVPDTARIAGALLLLYPREDRVHVVLTERHSDLPHHPGQISLPGGRAHATEPPRDAALRETHEEIGVAPDRVRVIGALTPLFIFISNFAIHPFVAVTDARPDFMPAAREVESIIEVPLDDVLDPARLQWGKKTRDGYLVDYPFFDLVGHQVWGATAMILGEFSCLFESAPR